MKTKAKRIWAWVGIAFLALIVLVLAVRVVFNYAAGRKLDAAVVRLKAEGKRLSIQEFEPGCKDEDNAALIWKGVEKMFIGDFDTGTTINRPFETLFSGQPLSDESRKLIAEAALKNGKSFELVRAAAAKSCFKYNTNWSNVDELEFPEAVKMLRCLRLFLLNSLLQAEKGNVDQAIDDCASVLRFAHLYLGEPFLLNRLIALALLRHQVFILNTLVSERKVDPGRIRYLLLLLESVPLRSTFPLVFEGERALSLGFYFNIIKGNEDIVETPFRTVNKPLSWVLRPLVKAEVVYSFGLWDAIEPAFRLPYYESREARNRFIKKFKTTPWHYKIIGYLAPDFSAVFVKETDREADLAVARVGLGCELFKGQNGRLPETLSELVPGILKDIPVDPYTGKSLIYNKSGDGFIVYSVGSNEKDDGGRGTWMRDKLVLEKDDDIAWRK